MKRLRFKGLFVQSRVEQTRSVSYSMFHKGIVSVFIIHQLDS